MFLFIWVLRRQIGSRLGQGIGGMGYVSFFHWCSADLKVDRSNGFEKLWFKTQNEKKALQEEWDRWEAGADD